MPRRCLALPSWHSTPAGSNLGAGEGGKAHAEMEGWSWREFSFAAETEGSEKLAEDCFSPWQNNFLKAGFFPLSGFHFSTTGMFVARSLSVSQTLKSLPPTTLQPPHLGFYSAGAAQTLAFGLRASARLIRPDQRWLSSWQSHALHSQAAGVGGNAWKSLFLASKLHLKPLLSPGQIRHSYTPTPTACTSSATFPPMLSGGEREVALRDQPITIVSGKQRALWKNILRL